MTPLIVMIVGVLLAAGAAFWTLRAVRRAGGNAGTGRFVLLICAGVSVLALGVYIINGHPELPGGAYAERIAALKQRPRETYTLDEWLAVLADDARINPSDPWPHLATGEILLRGRRPQEAARAFDAALRRDPRDADALIGVARSIAEIEGRFTPEALAYLEQASAVTDDARPWVYRAMAAMQSGRDADARQLWGEAYTRMSRDDPRREMARRFSTGQQP
ncbi:MAG: tetratricopeptide repeat protein [Alphaproteobacteria bacterium]|nr:tetratricopeptide repeat protein [Alphaproteobacteria bacterium]